MTQDKINAYMTLYTALVTTAKAAAPMVPFLSESIYRNLVCSLDPSAPESVHLCDFPRVQGGWIDQKLEQDMDEVLKIVVLGRAARNGANRKNRQPLAAMFVKASPLEPFYQDIIRDELNLKQVVFQDDLSEFTSYSFKPQLKTLGPRYGKKLGEIRTLLAGLNGSAAKKELDSTGALKLALSGGEEISLAPEDLLIEMTKSDRFFSVEDGDLTVAIDTLLTEDLIEEGFVREVISKVQTMRKDSGFEVMDHIRLWVWGDKEIEETVLKRKNILTIQDETLADEIHLEAHENGKKDWDINGKAASIAVEKV